MVAMRAANGFLVSQEQKKRKEKLQRLMLYLDHHQLIRQKSEEDVLHSMEINFITS